LCAAAAAAREPLLTRKRKHAKKPRQKKTPKKQALQQRLQEADAEADEQVERKRVMDRHARAVEAEIAGCEARVRPSCFSFGARACAAAPLAEAFSLSHPAVRTTP
jgi:hypothetical protein